MAKGCLVPGCGHQPIKIRCIRTDQRSNAGGPSQIIRIRSALREMNTIGQVVQGCLGGFVEIAVIAGEELLPAAFKVPGFETTVPGQRFQEKQGLVAVMGEVPGLFAFMIRCQRIEVTVRTAEFFIDHAGIVNPVGAQGQGIRHQCAPNGRRCFFIHDLPPCLNIPNMQEYNLVNLVITTEITEQHRDTCLSFLSVISVSSVVKQLHRTICSFAQIARRPLGARRVQVVH